MEIDSCFPVRRTVNMECVALLRIAGSKIVTKAIDSRTGCDKFRLKRRVASTSPRDQRNLYPLSWVSHFCFALIELDGKIKRERATVCGEACHAEASAFQSHKGNIAANEFLVFCFASLRFFNHFFPNSIHRWFFSIRCAAHEIRIDRVRTQREWCDLIAKQRPDNN